MKPYYQSQLTYLILPFLWLSNSRSENSLGVSLGFSGDRNTGILSFWCLKTNQSGKLHWPGEDCVKLSKQPHHYLAVIDGTWTWIYRLLNGVAESEPAAEMIFLYWFLYTYTQESETIVAPGQHPMSRFDINNHSGLPVLLIAPWFTCHVTPFHYSSVVMGDTWHTTAIVHLMIYRSACDIRSFLTAGFKWQDSWIRA